MGDRPTEFIYRGHKIVIVLNSIRHLSWIWMAEIDDEVPVLMGNPKGTRTRDEAIAGALAASKRMIERMG